MRCDVEQPIPGEEIKMDNASAKLGQKLLQGWTMLGDTCFKCSAPMMRSRDGSQTICVVCPLDVPPETSKPIEAPITHQIPTSSHNETVGDEALVSNILDSLLKVLTRVDIDIEPFCDVLEAALLPLKMLQISLSKDQSAAKQKIRNQISSKLSQLSQLSSLTSLHGLKHQFECMQRLLALRREFE